MKNRKQEILLYAAIWAIVFTMVPLVLALNTGMEDRSVWRELPTIWLGILPFLALFIAHDFAATPLLIKRRYAPYALVTSAPRPSSACWSCTQQKRLA